MKVSFDIDSLRAVVAGTDLGSFASAAVQLGRSQSAVSMQLKRLEQQAGTQLFVRKGRGLVPTEAGEALVAYARRIIALNDEAARALGAAESGTTLRLGLPQDFFHDVMPATLTAFARRHPEVHVDIQAGPNHYLGDQVNAGQLDVAISLCNQGRAPDGETLCHLPMRWIAHRSLAEPTLPSPLPLVLHTHPCLFRQATLKALEQAQMRWRAAISTPSLPGIWASLRARFGIAVRIEHGVPEDLVCLEDAAELPPLPNIDLRMLLAPDASSLARELANLLRQETLRRIGTP